MNWIVWCLIIVGGIVSIFLIANWQTKGLMFRLWSIKMFGGGRLLFKVKSKVDHYYKVGKLKDNGVRYKKRGDKVGTTLTIAPNIDPFYRCLGVFCVDVDEEKNAFFIPDASAVSGFDSETYENLIIRALMNPGDVINWKFVLIAIVVVFLAVVIVGFMVKGNGSKIVELGKLVKAGCEVAVTT